MYRERGLSLVELMISITLGLLLMAGVVQMFLSSKTVFSTQQSVSRIQETGRLAVDFIARDARNAGYYGCYRPLNSTNTTNAGKLTNLTLSVGGLHKNFDKGVVGFDQTSQLPSSAAVDLGMATAVANSSILVFRGAGQNGAIIHAQSTPTAISGYSPFPLSGTCVGDLCQSTVMVATDCSKAHVFLASNLSLAGNEVTLNHASEGAWIDDLKKGEILPMNTVVYFVAPGAGGLNSLWQRVNNGTPLELLEGVEAIYATYSIDKGVTYTLAAGMSAASWDSVSAMKIELLLRTADQNAVTSPQPYRFAGVNVTPPSTDRHMYQVFATTIDLRNRENPK